MEKIVFVIGHRNPDTDSVVSAVAYAALKRATGCPEARAARAGKGRGVVSIAGPMGGGMAVSLFCRWDELVCVMVPGKAARNVQYGRTRQTACQSRE